MGIEFSLLALRWEIFIQLNYKIIIVSYGIISIRKYISEYDYQLNYNPMVKTLIIIF